MHRPGRIGRDIFDIDLFGRADSAAAIGIALAQNGAQRVRPDVRLQGQIDEAGTGDIDLFDQVVSAQFCCDLLGKIARFCLGLLRQHHRGIGRHIAMRSIAGRFDHHARQIGVRPAAFSRERAQAAWTRASTLAKRCWEGAELTIGVTGTGICRTLRRGRRLTQIRGRVKKLLMLGHVGGPSHSGDPA